MSTGSLRTRSVDPREAVAWLVAADIVVLAAHLLRRLPLDGGLGLTPPGSFWSVTDQAGMAASLEVAQTALASLLVAGAAWRWRTPAVTLAAFALALFALTEVFDLHLRLAADLAFLGAFLADAGIRSPGAPKLLAALAIGGTALGLAFLSEATAGGRRERRIARDVRLVLLLFLGLGGGLDLAGRLVSVAGPSLVVAEEMAELLIATFACARLWRSCRMRRDDPCTAGRRTPSAGLRIAPEAARFVIARRRCA